MSQTGEERVQAFRDAVNASPELQAKVTAEEADWVEIAKAAGHEITAEEVQAYMTAHENDELSEFELGAVAGGQWINDSPLRCSLQRENQRKQRSNL